jgi:hypothetical protein
VRNRSGACVKEIERWTHGGFKCHGGVALGGHKRQGGVVIASGREGAAETIELHGARGARGQRR